MFSDLKTSVEPSQTKVFDANLKNVVSSQDTPSTVWSSIEDLESGGKEFVRMVKSHSYKRNENCTKLIAQSDIALRQHPYNKFSSAKDPRMKENLLGKVKQTFYPEDGQEYYKALCKKLNIAPLKVFYTKLVTTEINLDYYGVIPANIRAMAEALTYNRLVRVFSLVDNYLPPEACYHLGEMLVINTTLQKLVLGGCRMGLDGIINLSKGLLLNRGLKELDISRNILGEDGGQILIGCLADDSPILKLNVSSNNLSIKTANAFCATFEVKMSKFTHLNLSWNNFFLPRSTEKLLKSLVISARLKELNMSWNALEGKRIAEVIGALINSPILEVVDLNNNKFRDVETITALVANLEFAKNLHTFNLSFNPLSPTDAYIALEKMLTPAVRVKNLLMENIWVNKSFLKCLEAVNCMKERKKFNVTYAGVLEDKSSSGNDTRELVLRRAHFVGVTNKTQHVDVPGYFLKLSKQNPEPMPFPDFIERVIADVPLHHDLLMEMAFTFPVLSKDVKQTSLVDMAQISNFVQRLWPGKEVKLESGPKAELKSELKCPKPSKKFQIKGK